MSRSSRRDFMRLGALAALPMTAVAAVSAQAGARTTAPPQPADVRTGGVKVIRVDGKFNVWTKHVGPATGPQVLTLHGGPGAPHFYLECLEDFLPSAGIGFYYYDQLGCGFSDQPDDRSLWSVERFCGEVEQVREALGLEKFTLFGHSWGGLLGIEYALRYPSRLQGLVISNMAASVASYVAQLDRIRAAMPEPVKARFARYEAQGDFSSAGYEELLQKEFYRQHLCRLDPWPEPLLRTLRYLSAPVYNTMQGPDEFHVTGNLKSWNRWSDLARIRVPTLVIGGRYDEMSPDDIVRMGRLLPQGRSVVCEHGSHLAMYDDQQRYFSSLLGFIKSL